MEQADCDKSDADDEVVALSVRAFECAVQRDLGNALCMRCHRMRCRNRRPRLDMHRRSVRLQ